VTGLTDATGEITERYDYEPYGTPAPRSVGQWANTDDAASFGDDADVPTSQFGFAAGYRSVGGLYHYGQRYYDPDSMRWTQPDPLDQTGDPREGNRYIYVGSDPVNATDPSGEILITAGRLAYLGARAAYRQPAVRHRVNKIAYAAANTVQKTAEKIVKYGPKLDDYIDKFPGW